METTQMFRTKDSTQMSIQHVGVGSTLSVAQKQEWLIFAGEGARKVAALDLRTMIVSTPFIPVEDVHYLSKTEVEAIMSHLGNLTFSDYHISASGLKRV